MSRGNVIPDTGLYSPDVSRRLRNPDFKTIGTGRR
jgi:hypothetical protein